jgi:hypothetical protein
MEAHEVDPNQTDNKRVGRWRMAARPFYMQWEGKNMETVEKVEIENILKNYHWMINSIRIEKEALEEVNGNFTARYGDDAAQPRGGGTSDPVFAEVLRRGKRWEKIHRFENRVKIIQDRIQYVTDERQSEVLHWLLEGKSMRWIAYHMGLSKTHTTRLRDEIINTMYQKGRTDQKVQKVQ